jgi:PAS domain S-box-containing protein
VRAAEGERVFPSLRPLLAVLLVCVASYLATQVAFALRFPTVRVSVLFPPYAVLVAVLLLASPRRWWAYSLAAAAGHFIAARQAGWPIGLALQAEAIDLVKALVAAAGVRALGGVPFRFDTLRAVVVFLGFVGLLAPFVVATAGAGVVLAHNSGVEFRQAWRELALANAVTGITLLPVILTGIALVGSWRTKATPRRVLEACLLAGGLLAVSLLVFARPHAQPDLLPARLYAPMPFLLWAAVRFGVGGVSGSLLLVGLLAIGGAIGDRGPFPTPWRPNTVAHLQEYLLVLSVPLLFLAALVQEREQGLLALRESQSRYRLATSGGAVGVWDWTVGSDEIFIDPQLKGFLGYKDHELPNRMEAWIQCVHPEDRERVMAQAQAHLDGLIPEYDVAHRMLHRDGSVRWFLARGLAIRGADGAAVRLVGTDTDITERKRIEEDLERSEERYRSVVETQTELICRYRPDTTLTFVNDAYARFFGRSADELIGQKFLDLIPEPAREKAHRHVQSLIDHPRMVVYEHEVARPDGTIGWQEWVDHALLDRNGVCIELQGIGRDITARKRAQEEADRNRHVFVQMARAIPDLLYLYDLEERHVYFINDQIGEVLGYSSDQVEAMGDSLLQSLVHPEDLARTMEALNGAEALAGRETREREYRMRHADGSYRWLRSREVVFTRTPEGRVRQVLGLAQDITQSRAAGEALDQSAEQLRAVLARNREVVGALRTSSRRYRALIAASAQLVWRSTGHGETFFVPSAWQELTGQSQEQMQGMGWLDVVHLEDRARAAQIWQEALRTRTPYQSEFRVRTRDGSYRDLHVRGMPVWAADGRVSEWIGTSEDITERKRNAEALREARAELARAGRAMTMGELTATIAHEVSQPLGAVVSNAAACLQLLDLPDPDLQEVRAAVEDIARDGTRASQVIARIRALLKRGAAEREPLDVSEIMREVTALMQSEVHSRNVTLQADLAMELPPVLGDRVQLQQVVLNLVQNALDAMQGIEGRARVLHVSSRASEPGWVELSVRDTGAGLEPEALKSIFEPFYTTRADGVGLGLSICRKIVEAHGGHLWATPNSDAGVTFHFALPVREGAGS